MSDREHPEAANLVGPWCEEMMTRRGCPRRMGCQEPMEARTFSRGCVPSGKNSSVSNHGGERGPACHHSHDPPGDFVVQSPYLCALQGYQGLGLQRRPAFPERPSRVPLNSKLWPPLGPSGFLVLEASRWGEGHRPGKRNEPGHIETQQWGGRSVAPSDPLGHLWCFLAQLSG